MNVLVLGGCADMAAPLLGLLKKDPEMKTVCLADLNFEKAEKRAIAMGEKFCARRVNAEDSEAVTAMMQGRDMVFCFVGPFYRFEKRLARCAVEAGVHYVSICDDYDAYLDVITLEEEAQAAGVKILTGFGNSPGITQILARKGYNDVANPQRINVSWCAGSNEKAGVSNLTHLFYIFSGTTLQWLDGAARRVKTGQGKKRVAFPPPVGQCDVYYTGHAESVSLPRNLPGLTEVTLHGGVKPGYIVKLIKAMNALGMLSTHQKRVRLARFFHKIEGLFGAGGIDKSVGRIDVYGEADGKPQYKYFTYVGHIAEITSIPMYLAAKWCMAGAFNALPGGVYSAERLFPKPETFIGALKAMGVEMTESEIEAPL